MSCTHTVIVPILVSPLRLDVFLTEYFQSLDPDRYSRALIQEAIQSGTCLVNKSVVKKTGFKLKGNEGIEIVIQASTTTLIPDPEVKFEIVYEDDDILVVNKPPGLVVHPAPGVKESTLVHGIISHLQEVLMDDEAPERPGIVHRLDKDTSGVMVIAKNSRAKRNLQLQLKAPRTMKRVYHALCVGVPKERDGVVFHFDEEEGIITGRIDAPIIRHPYNRVRYMISKDKRGREALSHFRVLKAESYFSCIEFTLATGRTHQIRVHAEYMGCPIIGDPQYGPLVSTLPNQVLNRISSIRRQMLHAMRLSFIHPSTNEKVSFEGSLPDDFVLVESLIT
jgi:23S rRNA pseudouridine1911/1915/1917 synthase